MIFEFQRNAALANAAGGLSPNRRTLFHCAKVLRVQMRQKQSARSKRGVDILEKAQIIAQTKRLTVELAQIEGGGEGVLPALWVLGKRLARRRSLTDLEWIVHAVNCAKLSLKLRRVLERRGFTVENVPGAGEAFYQLHLLAKQPDVMPTF